MPIIEKDRIKKKSLGGGITLDFGIHSLQIQQYVFKGLDPINIVASGHLNEEGIDSSIAAIITYPSNKTALASASALVKLSCEGIYTETYWILRISHLKLSSSFFGKHLQ